MFHKWEYLWRLLQAYANTIAYLLFSWGQSAYTEKKKSSPPPFVLVLNLQNYISFFL